MSNYRLQAGDILVHEGWIYLAVMLNINSQRVIALRDCMKIPFG
jgi:hypothetical protein